MQFGAGAPTPPPPPPPAPSITLSSTGAATAGSAYAVTVTAANLTGALTVTPERVSGPATTFDPTTVLPAPGEMVKLFNLTAAAAGTLALRATAAGGIVSNTLPVTVNAAPAPGPTPPPPPPASLEGVGIAIRKTWGDASRLLMFNWDFGIEGGRYERFQMHKTVDARVATSVAVQFTGRNLNDNLHTLLGSSYSLTLDGSVVATVAVTPGTVTTASFTLPLTPVAEGWHTLDITSNDATEISIPFPVFVRKTATPADPVLMPVRRMAFDRAFELPEYTLAWVPAQFNPTPMPLPARTFTTFNTAEPITNLFREVLTPTPGANIRRPNRTSPADGGILNTSNRQAYQWDDYNRRLPVYPLLDGPRNVGTLSSVGHLAPANAAPGGTVRRTTYGVDSWRFFKIDETGAVKTLAGYRNKGVGRYWQESEFQEPVAASPSNPAGSLELVGDWSGIPSGAPIGFWALWGMAWDERTLAIDPGAPPVEGEQPHVVGPRAFVTDSKNDRVCRVQFAAAARTDPAITELYRGHAVGTRSPGDPLIEPWDCVFDSVRNVLYVSERRAHRIVERNPDTGALIRVVVQAASILSSVVGGVRPELNGGVSIADARAQDCQLPEGLFLQDDFLYWGSIVTRQVKRINLTTNVISLHHEWALEDVGARYVKIALSDGTFGPRGTVFRSTWAGSAGGYPKAHLPNGSPWSAFLTESAGNGPIRRGRIGVAGAPRHTGQGNYNGAVGVGHGRLLCSASTEGVSEFSLATGSDPAVIEYTELARAQRNNATIPAVLGDIELNDWDLLYGSNELCNWYGLPLPWGYSYPMDLWLEHMGHVRPAAASWRPATQWQAGLVTMGNTPGDVEVRGVWSYGQNANSFLAYSGGAYSPYTDSTYIHGGGHSAGDDNSVLDAHYASQLFRRLLGPTNLQALGKYVDYTTGGYGVDIGTFRTSYDYFAVRGPNSTGWLTPTNSGLWEYQPAQQDQNPAQYVPGVPASDHTYGNLLVVPPHISKDSRGGLLRPVSTVAANTPQISSGWAHLFRPTAAQWGQFGAGPMLPRAAVTAAGGFSYDTLRDHALFANRGNNESAWLNVRTGVWTGFFNASPWEGNVVTKYHRTRDLHVICFGRVSSGANSVWHYIAGGLATPGASRSDVTWTNGTPPPKSNGGFLADDPRRGVMYYWTRSGGDTLYEIQIPANPATAWTWVARTLTGAGRPSVLSPAVAQSTYGRADYSLKHRAILWPVGQAGAGGDDTDPTAFGGRVVCISVE